MSVALTSTTLLLIGYLSGGLRGLLIAGVLAFVTSTIAALTFGRTLARGDDAVPVGIRRTRAHDKTAAGIALARRRVLGLAILLLLIGISTLAAGVPAVATVIALGGAIVIFGASVALGRMNRGR